jgi:hypothetical protein
MTKFTTSVRIAAGFSAVVSLLGAVVHANAARGSPSFYLNSFSRQEAAPAVTQRLRSCKIAVMKSRRLGAREVGPKAAHRLRPC